MKIKLIKFFVITFLFKNISMFCMSYDEIKALYDSIIIQKRQKKIREEVESYFNKNNILPSNYLADIISDYAIFTKKEYLEANEKLKKIMNSAECLKNIKLIKAVIDEGADINLFFEGDTLLVRC